MCNCPGDEVDPVTEFVPPRVNPEISPQDQVPQRRRKQPCCRARRVLTYEDETHCNTEPIPLPAPPPPPPPSTPVHQCRPALTRCELVGTAIVRRRIDCGTSPERRDATSREVTPTDRSKAEGKEKPIDESQKEKPPEKDAEKDKDQTTEPEKQKDKEGESTTAQQIDEATVPQISVTPVTPEKEPENKGEEPKPETTATEGITKTSTPCPGMLDPKNDCNCSAIPKPTSTPPP